jgi:hypothetical protein
MSDSGPIISAHESRPALATLCQTCWPAVYAFVWKNGYDLEQSQARTQGFSTQLIVKRFLVDADQHGAVWLWDTASGKVLIQLRESSALMKCAR